MRDPRTLKREEFDELLNMLIRIFRIDKQGYNLSYWRGVYDHDLEDILVIEEDGRVVSHVSVFPFQISVRGSQLKVGEVGGVATDENYRRRGFASSLLKYSVEKMAREGYDLSSLGGYRDRYGRWGWELAGEEWVYTVDKRSIQAVKETTGVEFWQYAGDRSDLTKIAELHDGEPVRTLRSWQMYQLLFNNLPKVTMQAWLAEVSGLGLSYFVFNRSSEKAAAIVEFGGNPEVFKLLIKKLFDEEGLDKVTIVAPSIYTPFTSALTEISGHYQINAFRMIRIINLKGCLQKLAPIIEDRLKKVEFRSPFALSLEATDTGQRATLIFDGNLQICSEPGKGKVTLDQRSMVRLLFGPRKATKNFDFRGRLGRLLNTIFPLDFYIWPLDRR